MVQNKSKLWQQLLWKNLSPRLYFLLYNSFCSLNFISCPDQRDTKEDVLGRWPGKELQMSFLTCEKLLNGLINCRISNLFPFFLSWWKHLIQILKPRSALQFCLHATAFLIHLLSSEFMNLWIPKPMKDTVWDLVEVVEASLRLDLHLLWDSVSLNKWNRSDIKASTT